MTCPALGGDRAEITAPAGLAGKLHDNRKTEIIREAGYPSPRPDLWYGSAAPDRRHLYLFDRGSVGVIRWDSQTETGKPIPGPYQTPPPASGRIESRDNALWCHVWGPGTQYRPIGSAQMDLPTDTFTGFYPFPEEFVLPRLGPAEKKPVVA
jgi:hypothetical protein